MPIFRRQDEAPRERSEEERERARAERAARRAARGGAVADPPLRPPAPRHEETEGVAFEPPPRHEPEEIAFEPPPREEPEEIAFEPPSRDEPEEIALEPPPREEPDEPAFEPPPREEPSLDEVPLQPTVAFDPLSASADDAVAPEDERLGSGAVGPVHPVGSAPPEPEPELIAEEPEPEPIVTPAARRARSGRPAPVVGDEDERPVAPKRVSARERTLPPTPPPPGTPAFSKRRRRRGRILAATALLLLAAFLFGLNMLFQPFKGDGGATVSVRIPPNSTVADVGDVLADNDIVDSSLVFVIRARLAGADLKAGTYQLKKDSSYGDVLDALGDDPAAPRTIKVVIPEGRSRQETAPLVKEAGLEGSYLGATDTQKGFRPRKYGAPRATKTLEGFLFPATYELTPGADVDKLVKQQLDAFEQNVAQVDMKRARKRNLTTYDVLVIASMVEREATLPKERPIIAAVIHNRLRQGMPLGIDATIRYAVRNWTEPLKQSELNIDSPYNTRKRTGLPPTPIGSPGLDSIRAAANPAKVDYLFYVVKPGGNGAHNFSSTDAEFQEDVDAYNRARERRGGKSPASSG